MPAGLMSNEAENVFPTGPTHQAQIYFTCVYIYRYIYVIYVSYIYIYTCPVTQIKEKRRAL